MRPPFAVVVALSLAACGEAPPPVVVAIAPIVPNDAAVETSAQNAGVPPARLRTLDASDNVTCLVRGGKLWCFGDTPDHGGVSEYDDSMRVPRVVEGVDDATSLAVNGQLACVVRRGGGVACFGVVDDGTRGTGAGPRYSARRVAKLEAIDGLSAIQIAVGRGFGCAVRAGGDVACWGVNGNGQLGDTSSTGHLTPAAVAGIDDAIEVAAGDSFACVRRRSGAVWCWGTASRVGSLKDPSVALPHPVLAFAGAFHIRAIRDRVCALRPGGDVVCTEPPTFAMTLPEQLGAVDLAPGADMICGLTATGGVVCSGEADAGQLGVAGERMPYAQRAAVDGINDAIEIAAGASHACALTKSGALRCWGKNDRGQIGAPTSQRIATPTKVPGVGDVIRVALSGSTACAVAKAGNVTCWGDSSAGALGSGDAGQDATGLPLDVSPPVAVPEIADATDIAAGDQHFCVVRKSGKVSCWGDDRWGQLGDGTSEGGGPATPFEVPTISDAIDIDANGIATCVARKSGSVTCWGTPPDVHTPKLAQLWTGPDKGTAVGLRGVARIGANDDRGCAVRRDGTAACWGFEADALRDASDPKRAFVELRGTRDVAQIAVGDDGLVLLRSGELRHLDFHETFRAGQAPRAPLPLGPKIADDARSLARCVSGECFVRKSGEVSCLVDGKVRAVGISDAVDVAAGASTFCAVRKNGEVDCWGDNDSGQCGVDPHAYSLTPVQVAGL